MEKIAVIGSDISELAINYLLKYNYQSLSTRKIIILVLMRVL